MRCVNCCVGVNTVATVWLFMGIKFTWISLGFLSVKIYSYAWCLRYICSAWFLDIRISTCFFIISCRLVAIHAACSHQYFALRLVQISPFANVLPLKSFLFIIFHYIILKSAM